MAIKLFWVSFMNLAVVSLNRIDQPSLSNRGQEVQVISSKESASDNMEVNNLIYRVNESQEDKEGKEVLVKYGHSETDSMSKPPLTTRNFIQEQQKHPNPKEDKEGEEVLVKYGHSETDSMSKPPLTTRNFIQEQQKHPNPKRYTRTRQVDPIPILIEQLKRDEADVNKHIHHSIEHIKAAALLVMVESLPSSQFWRQSIRDTWGSAMPSESVLVFVVPFHEPEEEEDVLLKESEQYRDIILFKLTHRLSSVRLMQYLFWCTKLYNYRYLIRTTDEYFVRVDSILKSLSSFRPKDKVYMGYFKGNVNVSKGETTWFVCPTLVPHADEGMYLLSRPLVDKFIQHCFFLSYFQSEGASVGLWASPFKNIKLVHRVDFDAYESRGCLNSYVATREFDEEGMRVRYDRLHSGGAFCSKEFERVKSYKYNWSTIPSRCCD